MQSPSFVSDPANLLVLLGVLFVHACYQLSVSVLSHFSLHTLGRRVSSQRLLLLGLSYTFGAIVSTSLILCAAASLVSLVVSQNAVQLFTAFVVGFTPFIGLATILWYYRKGDGTQLWLPRSIAHYLLKRSKKTNSLVEAAFLGSASTVGELPFLIAPLLFVTFYLSRLPSGTWLGWSSLYSLLACLPLIVVTMYLSSGHTVARVQRWRTENKKFLQWTSGLMLVVLAMYFTVLQIGAVS